MNYRKLPKFMIPFRRLFVFLPALLLIFAGAAVLTGCAGRDNFAAPTADWQTFTGQMYYSGTRSVVGDVVVRRLGQSDFRLEFSSGPGFPLMRLSQSAIRSRAEGVFAHGSWQGGAEHAPKLLRSWLHLRDVFTALPGHDGSFRQGPWRAQAHYTEGKLEQLTISNSNGERFAFHFSR